MKTAEEIRAEAEKKNFSIAGIEIYVKGYQSAQSSIEPEIEKRAIEFSKYCQRNALSLGEDMWETIEDEGQVIKTNAQMYLDWQEECEIKDKK